MIDEKFVILGAAINLLGGLSYLIDTLKGKAQPNRISWGLWSLAVFIGFAAEYKQGVGIQSWTIFSIGVSTSLIFLGSFVNKKTNWKLSIFDYICGAFSFLAIILWIITNNPNLAILFSIFADLAAGIPTLRKSYNYPETENWIEYSTSFVNIILSILTLKIFSFATLAFSLYILIFDLLCILLVKFKIGIFFNKRFSTK